MATSVLDAPLPVPAVPARRWWPATVLALAAVCGLEALALLAGFLPLGTLAELVNIGTLFAFVLVSIAVIVLRRTRPDLHRAFKVPLVPFLPILSALACLYLMLNLPADTWLRFAIWMALGFVLYFTYGRRRSRLAGAEGEAAAERLVADREARRTTR